MLTIVGVPGELVKTHTIYAMAAYKINKAVRLHCFDKGKLTANIGSPKLNFRSILKNQIFIFKFQKAMLTSSEKGTGMPASIRCCASRI